MFKKNPLFTVQNLNKILVLICETSRSWFTHCGGRGQSSLSNSRGVSPSTEDLVQSWSRLHFPTLGDYHWQFGFIVRARGNILDFSHHQKSINDFSKHYVLPIQPITLRTCDKELAAVCTGTTVCHGKQAGSRVSKFKIFICKWTAVNASDSSTISLNRAEIR